MEQVSLSKKEILGMLEEMVKAKLAKPIRAGHDLIPAAAPTLGSGDIISGIESLLGCWLTEGEQCNLFEKKLKSFFNAADVVLTNSGSSANLLAFSALTSPFLNERALKAGDEVITLAAGFPTTVNPIIQNGLIPVFVDITLPQYNIDVNALENAIGPKTKAIMMAHSLGNPFNLREVVKVAKKHNLWLIEDNCDAFGATYDSKPTGSFGDLSTLSFFPAHHITTGEGGAVIINNPVLKKIVNSFRNWGRDCWCLPGDDNTCGKRFCQRHGDLPYGYDHKYVFSHIGYNLKMTETQAAIGNSQMEKIHEFVEARRVNFNYLYQKFSSLSDYFELPEHEVEANPSWFGFLLRCKEGLDRNKLIEQLNHRKIGTRLFFAGNIVKQPAYKDVTYRVHDNLKNTDIAMNQSFWIGVWPGLNEEHLDYIFNSVREVVAQKL